MIRLWLDDERPTPEGWVGVKTAQEAIDLIATGNVEEVSLDHDLGEDYITDGTGYDVALFIEKGAYFGALKPIKWSVHSANPAGSSRMQAALESADRFWSLNK